MRISHRVLLAAALTVLPSVAFAHPAPYMHTHTFLDGVAHPLSGLDHLMAMIAVGTLAAQKGGRALWLWPASFVSAMILGGTAGMMGHALPLVEPVIASSLLVLGLMIATMVDLPMVAGVGIVAAFGLFHGNAHGLEAPLTGSGLLYGLGFTLSTITLHVIGLSAGLAARDTPSKILLRAGAGVVAVTGAMMLFT